VGIQAVPTPIHLLQTAEMLVLFVCNCVCHRV